MAANPTPTRTQETAVAKAPFDADALIEMFENASTRGSTQLRSAVEQATLAALQGREMTVKNIRGALEAVTQAVTQGAAKNVAGVDPAALLDRAVQGMDDALLKAVQANRTALQQFVDRGADLREKHLKKAVADLEKFEDTLIESVEKSAGKASADMAAAWGQVLERLNAGGTLSGAKAATTAEQFQQQMKDIQSAMRDTRAAGLRAAQALAESYTAMVSGVLIGMADAMRQPAAKSGGARAKK